MKKLNSVLLKTVLVTVIIFIGHSCVKLEEDTSSILQIENLPDEGAINASITPIYRAFMEYGRYQHEKQMTGYGSDDETTWSAGNKAPFRVFDRFDYGDGQNSDIQWLPNTWDKLWKVIYYSNSLIEGLKTSKADPAVIKVADAEARFFRAYSYLYLVKAWGNMPIILDGMTPTGKEVRATVLQNYEHIEEDLKIAEVNLPDPGQTSNFGRASKSAAKTLYADLCMTWAGWPIKDAAKYAVAAQKAKEVIDMGYHKLLKGDQLWLFQNQNSLESVYSIQFSEEENIVNTIPSNTIFHESRGWSDLIPELTFFNEFPAGPRKDWTFYVDIPQRGVVNGVIVDLVPPTKPWLISQRKHPMYKKFDVSGRPDIADRWVSYRAYEIYRYAEVLLIYAEASARANGGTATGDAIEALNQIKRRAAGLPYDVANPAVDVTTATADQIMQEKAWELAGEAKRWWDLVRTETVAAVNARRDPKEDVKLAIPVSQISWKHYIAPIPYSALTNSDLVQNPEGFQAQ